jgi:hypothetical protein
VQVLAESHTEHLSGHAKQLVANEFSAGVPKYPNLHSQSFPLTFAFSS